MSEKKSFIKGMYNWAFLSIVIVAIILLNIISSFLNKRWDITEDQRYSLSKGTIEYLKDENSFKNRLTIRIYFEGNLPSELKMFRNAIEDKLKEFKEYAGKRIEYQFINPNPANATEGEIRELQETLYAKGKGILPMDIVYMKDGSQNQILMWPGAVIDYEGSTVNTVQFLPGTPPGKPYQLQGITDMIQNSINNLEYMLTSAIRRATQNKKPRIGFLQGHGELTYANTQRMRSLISPFYAIADITLNDSLAALENIDGLIIARPRTQFSDKDLYIIDQFVMKGGRLMCFLDALQINEDTLNANGQTHTTRYNTGLDKMLFDYGLKLNENYVIDAQCVPKPVPFAKQSMIPWFYQVLATPTSHPIARNLEFVSLKYTSEVQFVGTDKNVMSPILTSSTNSTRTGLAPMVNLAMALNYGKVPELVPNPNDEANKVCLAGLVEGAFESHFKNRIVDEFANNPLVQFKDRSTKEGKVLLVGNGRFIANKADSMINNNGVMMYRPQQVNDLRFDENLAQLGVPHSFGNQEFIQNMTDYMMGDNSIIDIRSKQIDVHAIDNDKVKSSSGFYKIINLLIPCGIILLLAFLMHYLRKRKYTKH
jgi:ABC-2 type transport system permease protein